MCWRHGNSPETVNNKINELKDESELIKTDKNNKQNRNFNCEVFKILPGDLGKIFVIEGSTIGATF